MTSKQWQTLPAVENTWLHCPDLWRTTAVLWEKAMAPHSSTVAWKIPWKEEPGRLQSLGSLRVGHDWSDLAAGRSNCCSLKALRMQRGFREILMVLNFPIFQIPFFGQSQYIYIKTNGSHLFNWSVIKKGARKMEKG